MTDHLTIMEKKRGGGYFPFFELLSLHVTENNILT